MKIDSSSYLEAQRHTSLTRAKPSEPPLTKSAQVQPSRYDLTNINQDETIRLGRELVDKGRLSELDTAVLTIQPHSFRPRRRSSRQSIRGFSCMKWLVLAFILGMNQSAWADAPAWQLLSREEGCVQTSALVRSERLPHAPVSPEDLVAMLRAQGRSAEIAPVPGFPPEMDRDFVLVRLSDGTGPIFALRESCARINAGLR